jgi:capsule polysaccharide export protein KpsE/RkpR
MRAFQEKTGILKADLQTGTVIESIANLRAQLVAKEVELNVMRSYSTPNNPDLQRIEETIKGLKKELGKIGGTDLSDKYVTNL